MFRGIESGWKKNSCFYIKFNFTFVSSKRGNSSLKSRTHNDTNIV